MSYTIENENINLLLAADDGCDRISNFGTRCWESMQDALEEYRNDLSSRSRDELNVIGNKLQVRKYRRLKKADLVERILDCGLPRVRHVLNVTWWDKYRTHVTLLATLGAVASILALILYFVPSEAEKQSQEELVAIRNSQDDLRQGQDDIKRVLEMESSPVNAEKLRKKYPAGYILFYTDESSLQYKLPDSWYVVGETGRVISIDREAAHVLLPDVMHPRRKHRIVGVVVAISRREVPASFRFPGLPQAVFEVLLNEPNGVCWVLGFER